MFFCEDERTIKKIANKIKELVNNTNYMFFKFKEAQLNELGDKKCQFFDVYTMAYNYFNDDKFEEFLNTSKFDDLLVLRQLENEYLPKIIYQSEVK
jgi:hypothetical protein